MSEPISNLCFLTTARQAVLEKLIKDTCALDSDISHSLEAADTAARTLLKGLKEPPLRDPTESGIKHDKDVREWMRQRFDLYEQALQIRWETCAQALDKTEELTKQQEKIEMFLLEEERNRPPVGSKQAMLAERRIPHVQHKALQVLEDTLWNYTYAPLVDMHTKQWTELVWMTGDISRLSDEQNRHYSDGARKIALVMIHDTMESNGTAAKYNKELIDIDHAMSKSMDDLADISGALSAYHQATKCRTRHI